MPDEQAKLAETLDAEPYEPPKPRRGRRSIGLWVAGIALLVQLLILLAMEMFSTRGHPGRATRLLVREIEMACGMYQFALGDCPWADVSTVTPTTQITGKEVCALLGGHNQIKRDFLGEVILPLRDNPAWCARYMRDGAPVDEWSREIVFRVDPTTKRPVIWSFGKNGIDETNDGESPDPVKLPKGYYWFGAGNTGDDITTLSKP